jgi:hypothetical protein
LAGRSRRLTGSLGRFDECNAEYRLDVAARDPPRPQQRRRRTEAADDRGFQSDLGRTAVDDEVGATVEVGGHVRGKCRRHMTRAVGRRRNHRPAECAQQHL